jgi:hypothetical protein
MLQVERVGALCWRCPADAAAARLHHDVAQAVACDFETVAAALASAIIRYLSNNSGTWTKPRQCRCSTTVPKEHENNPLNSFVFKISNFEKPYGLTKRKFLKST